jgi:hypothetical protein
MNILKEDEYVDNAYSKGNEPTDNPIDDYDELDVEQEDMDDFINFLKAYSTQLDEAEYQGSLVTLRFPALRDTEREWSECTALRVGGLLLPLPKFVVGVMRSGIKKNENLNPSDELKSQESL